MESAETPPDAAPAPAPAPPTETGLPQAVIHPPHRTPLPLVWIVPIIAALIGAWVGFNALLNRGPSIVIEFRSAEGLEAGRPESATAASTSASCARSS